MIGIALQTFDNADKSKQCSAASFAIIKRSKNVIYRIAVRFLSVDNSLTEDRDCDERDNFILSVEDVNEREQNDFDQPDQLHASDEEEKEPLNNECGRGDQLFPFNSKLHMLLYIFKNSPTHSVVRHGYINGLYTVLYILYM